MDPSYILNGSSKEMESVLIEVEKEDRLRDAEDELREEKVKVGKLVEIINSKIIEIFGAPHSQSLSAEKIIELYEGIVNKTVLHGLNSHHNSTFFHNPDESDLSILQKIEEEEDKYIEGLKRDKVVYSIELKKLEKKLLERDSTISELQGVVKGLIDDINELTDNCTSALDDNCEKISKLEAEIYEKDKLISQLKDKLEEEESKSKQKLEELTDQFNQLSISQVLIHDAEKKTWEEQKLELYMNIDVEISDEFIKEGGFLFKDEIINKQDDSEIPIEGDDKKTGTYRGSSVNGIPHGKGQMTFDGREVIKGSFLNGMKHGKFDITNYHEDVAYSEAQYRYHKLHGHQVHHYKNGFILYYVYDNGIKLEIEKKMNIGK